MDGCHIALATGNDAGGGRGLTAWRNADVIFDVLELIPSDGFLGWNNKLPQEFLLERGSMSSSRVPDSVRTGRTTGLWSSIHAFQTAQFCHWLMQTEAPTTENTPVGYNTHVLTIGAFNTPKWHGIHFEREGIGSNELRYDLMGFLPSDLIIKCGHSKENYDAKQEIKIPYAFANTAAGNITAQTPRPEMDIGSKWKTWKHLIDGNGAGKEPTGFTYIGATMEVDIINVELHLQRYIKFGVPVSGYYTSGIMMGFNYMIRLDVVPTGDMLYALNKLDTDAYGGELDYHASFQADAAKDYIDFNFDKLKLKKFDEKNDYKSWFEGYSIELLPLNTTSSLTTTGIDILNNDHYENP